MPSANNVYGLWPAIWTMGNLGRAGYGATLEGLVCLKQCDIAAFDYINLNSGLTHMTLVILAQSPIRQSTAFQQPLLWVVIQVKEVHYLFFRDSGYRGVHVRERVIPVLNIQTVALLEGRLPKSTFSRPR